MGIKWGIIPTSYFTEMAVNTINVFEILRCYNDGHHGWGEGQGRGNQDLNTMLEKKGKRVLNSFLLTEQ